jgi:hypothetical protein
MADQPNTDVKVVDDKLAEANERVGRIRQEAGSGADQTKAKGNNGDDDIAQASLSGRSEADLRKASEDLKGRIEEAKRANNMPLDSALGSPDFEKRAADGHLDRPEDEDE